MRMSLCAILTRRASIEDFVVAKQQVLTYKWLSSQLAVPFDLAKQMLFEFKRQKKHAVYCTYVLGGVPVDADELTFALIREEDLEQSKKRFRELVCQHVYSVGPSRPELLETIFASENPRFVDLLQDPKSAQTVNYLTNRFSPIANEEVVHKQTGVFRPAYLSPKQATPETKWADSFQKLEVTESMAATKRKIGFVLDDKKSSTPTAAGTPKDVAPAGTLPTTASVPAKAGKKGKKGAKPAEKFVLPDVPEVDEPVLPPPPKGSLAAFLSSGGRKESDPKKAELAAGAPVEKKPFFGAVKAKKAAAAVVTPPPPPSPSKKQKKEEPESGGAGASKRLKKRDSKQEAEEEDVKIIGSDDEIFMEDKSSSSDKEEELPPIAEKEEDEDEDEEEKPKTPKKSPRKKAAVSFEIALLFSYT
jgi:hypothetical protein